MLYGDRIRLRAIDKADLLHFVEWFNDPEVIEGLTMIVPMSLEQEEKWYENMLKRPMDEQPLCIEVRVSDGWKLIGNMSFFDIDRRIRAAEIGIVIGEKSYWNQGLGGEALRVMLRLGFNVLNLNRITLRVYETNRRAIKSYRKIGFIQEGILRQAEFRDGSYIDVLLMSMLRDEWREV